MIRNGAGIIAGVVTAFVLIAAIEKVGHLIYPPPVDLDYSDPDVMRPYFATLPLIALLFPMLAWFTGTFAGSLAACYIGTARPVIFVGIVGSLVFARTVADLILNPHPLWFSMVSLAGIVASAWLAMQLASKKES